MAQSVKLSDGSYIDTEGIYDVTQGKTQKAVNDTIQRLKSASMEITADASGYVTGLPSTTVMAYTTNGYFVFRCAGQKWRVYSGGASTMTLITNKTMTAWYTYYE